MIIDAVSDLHGHYPKLEGGDLLIVAGDVTATEEEKSWVAFEHWICSQNYKEKIIIGGNHDNFLASRDEPRMWKYWEKVNVTYLYDSDIELEYDETVRNLFNSEDKSLIYRKKLKIWGSPWTSQFQGINPHCCAFTRPEGESLADRWTLIPDDVDILITHSPPFGIFDQVSRNQKNVGDTALLHELSYRLKPKLHVFGHIHEHGGKKMVLKREGIGTENNTICVNASFVNERYQPVNKPVRIVF